MNKCSQQGGSAWKRPVQLEKGPAHPSKSARSAPPFRGEFVPQRIPPLFSDKKSAPRGRTERPQVISVRKYAASALPDGDGMASMLRLYQYNPSRAIRQAHRSLIHGFLNAYWRGVFRILNPLQKVFAPLRKCLTERLLRRGIFILGHIQLLHHTVLTTAQHPGCIFATQI